jgi:hypothetical protein
MIGDKIVENERGRVTGTRVLEPEGGPAVELTFQTTAKILGKDASNIGTVVSRPKADGMFAEGRGIVTTTGGEMASWVFAGPVTITGPMPAGSFRGSVFFTTNSPGLARLNKICAVVEAQTDAEGNMSAELWEWR